MADPVLLYTNPMSRGQIARWMLEEVGAPYEAVILDYAGGMKTADYRAINPMGKVPAIVHGGKVVTECAAICAYLADAFPAAGLAPATDDRADYYRWLFFAAGPVEAAVTNKAMGFVLPEGRERSAGYGSLDDTLDTLETAVTGRSWICGGTFTAADVYVGAQIDWGLTFGTIPSRPAFEAYAARLRERPAYKRQKEIDNALIAEMQKQG
ncbi:MULTISPECIES: glutathione S-transferase family protein [Sphingobium]|jgi:glutathione S-transferase|uniref:Glutathione S-transferase family protein n=1 Tax=Sphingobium yanoikuyae TaxID=13690 RepID=A0A085K1M7_SPHYA|nr:MULTISPECIES: glutathione S-transferase family protein [Sphingobium]AYO80444.1 glutathione S-transferase family protein [Sphingobium yanoikuyae]KFD26623.1 glutathione S-transferase [Sphingobium yanoikuyae]KZC81570.1 glutathione S-transferase [Sphingobium yanoikuyae]MDV3478722.1 glutathione S-transferase family protein [Sphingobium yanoikuyae]PHP16858.1 glutathione S-transferase family protein [Sphingobium sp. IP1]